MSRTERPVVERVGPVSKETSKHQQFNRPKKEFGDITESASAFFNLNDDIQLDIRSVDDGLDADNSDEINRKCPWTNNRRPACNTNPRYLFQI